MSSENFKTAARDLAKTLDSIGITYDVYMLLTLTDALMAKGFAPTPDYSTHAGRVQAALNDPEVMQHMYEGKKINAIKRLRTLTLAGLKDAKDAVEDDRVGIAANLMSNPWDHHNYEPPF